MPVETSPISVRADAPLSVRDALAAGRLTPLDGAMALAVALDVIGSAVAARLAVGWATAAAIDVVVCLYLGALLLRPAWRGLVGRLLVLGFVAGLLEIGTDFGGVHVVHSLAYPASEPFLLASPVYMPVSWMVVLVPLAYLAWRLVSLAPRVPLWAAMLVVGTWSALNIPFYEEMAYSAGWWHYTNPLRIGHTPLYVILFEGLIGAVLPPLVRGVAALPPRAVALRGVVLGLWTPCAALLAWLALGH